MIGPARGHDGAAHRLRQPVSLAGRRQPSALAVTEPSALRRWCTAANDPRPRASWIPDCQGPVWRRAKPQARPAMVTVGWWPSPVPG